MSVEWCHGGDGRDGLGALGPIIRAAQADHTFPLLALMTFDHSASDPLHDGPKDGRGTVQFYAYWALAAGTSVGGTIFGRRQGAWD